MSELSALQEAMARALRERRDLAKDPEWVRFAEQHLSGGPDLSPVEQLEVYREQFWFRHTSSLVEDFPGLSGILGQTEWERLVEEYLIAFPPHTYTLRDLGARLPDFVEQCGWLSHRELCVDMARLEVAYLEAFDAADSPHLAPERLAALSEEQLMGSQLVLAPSSRHLRVRYPVANLRRELAKEHTASIPDRADQCVVVYRSEGQLRDFVVTDTAFAFLRALASGIRLGDAAELVASQSEDAARELEAHVASWFQEWTRKGVICDLRWSSS